ncbi:MAG TPA: ParB N-terminal domain-containing protein [Acidimicrobiia bacterium]|jgi:hypothetical protein
MSPETDPDAEQSFSLASARTAAAAGDTAQWVGDYLASRGSDNATLAAGLAARPHHWFGPMRVPLAQLVRLAGPESDATCRIDPAEWAHDVEAMESSLEQGWAAPPLLAELRDGQLLLQDGNHRYEALARAGEPRVWVIVWCDDDNASEELRAALA